ncbi:SpoVT / AbrB-like protein [Candidatus Methanoperedens nitroreducens]|uniref:SpoVT / AbrB-like protein n=1 Tax=Candidatus Methanoperedens nitratireducens TaxID=1392998 RepID=A0A062V8M3_9EURY|nr:AbrB/MazE/SpoVT family DNA-binding domain-containing protein [Candidatus Methanoperedens nitroreducens]KCZ73647.1 SpoVT / AbrB-like protein [Candidatus Methanoperedens nitroreducens]MDJ1422393.1 AbrB/MazE/SpoVT family DNA-binding domain-containing protein [Candidatus Methanoperedens sp.]
MKYTRTIQAQHGSYVSVLPKPLVELMELRAGDKIVFRLLKNGKKIVVAPVKPAKTKADATHANHVDVTADDILPL